MTRHPPDPFCDCDFCFAVDLNAVLLRFIEQRLSRQAEIDTRNAAAVRLESDKAQWRDVEAGA